MKTLSRWRRAGPEQAASRPALAGSFGAGRAEEPTTSPAATGAGAGREGPGLARRRRGRLWGSVMVGVAGVLAGALLVLVTGTVLPALAPVTVAGIGLAWLQRGRPDQAGGAGQQGLEVPERDVEQWTGGGALATKAVTALVVAALLTGPASVAWLVLHRGGPAATPSAVSAREQADLSARRGAAQARASEWVHAWLTTPAARADLLDRFWSGELDLPASPAKVAAVSVVDAVASAPGVWSVTVAVDQAKARRYFQVPVSVAGGQGTAGARVLSLPAPVAGPRTAPDVVESYPVQVGGDSPLFQTVQAFVSALVTGDGDITRYLSPGAAIRPIRPPLAPASEVTELVAGSDSPGVSTGRPPSGAVVAVLATIRLASPGPSSSAAPASSGLGAQYALTLTARAGRWEVTAIDPNPLIRTARSDPR